MSADDPRQVLRSIHEALNKRDVDKAVSFFADDVVSVGPNGTFKGKAEVKRYFELMLHQATEFKLTETGIYAEGNVVTHEYVIEETVKEGKMSSPSVAVAEIKNGKVQRIRDYYDRLAVAKQLAKGVFATRTVNSIINQMEKGLH
jgi:limonene-1,2-epoxide hydrolase